MNICEIGKNFEFNNLTLAQPNGLQGGSYFTRLLLNDDSVYIQAPACQTKQGIVTNGKKSYCDLMFTNDNEEILDWFENIEKTLIDKIYEKRNIWFHNNLEKEDIENAFTSLMRVYKSGRFYLVRVNLAKNSSAQKPFTCYDDQENPVDPEVIKDPNIKVIPLLEFLGVKFSTKSFQIEVCLRQLMVLNETENFNTCLIKKKKLSNENETPSESTITNETPSESTITNETPSESTITNETPSESLNEVSPTSQISSIDLGDSGLNAKEKQSESTFELLAENKDLHNEMLTNVENSIKTLDDKDEFDDNDLEKSTENVNSLEEIVLDIENLGDSETLALKKPNEVYFEIWREARIAAKQARKQAIGAYLNAKNIKATYMLDEIDDDSSDEFDSYLESLNETEMPSIV